MKRRYNAAYRLRKKGFEINTLAKTIYSTGPEITSEMKILIEEFHFVIQTRLPFD